jgi:hypothetical protein
MRTTISIDDDLMVLVRRHARGRRVSLGRAISDLVHKALTSQTPIRRERGVVVFDLPGDSPAVTTEDVKRLEDQTP